MESARLAGWRDYVESRDGREHSVVGDLRVLERVESEALGNARDVLVHLPPSYEATSRSYPVVYMQDGQNLFDRVTSFAGEWGVDETMHSLAAEGIEAIVVGVQNTPTRMDEYSPFADARGGGKGDAYVRFLVETVKPLVDREFRTARESTSTGILGSSMGGLISLYALFSRPETFGFAGALSPSLFFARGAMLAHVAKEPFRGGRLYLDIGEREGPNRLAIFPFRRYFLPHVSRVREMRKLLVGKGYREGVDLRVVEDRAGRHNEADWGRRLPDALRFLLGPNRTARSR